MSTSLGKSSRLEYRADIDGLRAVAVLFVLAYHLGIHRLSGGFVGVDIFFVISGFLISSVILSELNRSRFSIVSFYERRVRRICPALVVLLTCTTLLAYRFLLPSEMVAYGKSLVAATFSLSNIFFLHESGYFDAPASVKPLLHTWSLGVEEQFYVFLPLFLVGVRKAFPNKQRLLVVMVALLSFVVSAVGAFRNHDATFYLAYTRAWELLLGTMISQNLFWAFPTPLWRNIASSSGALMILLAGVVFTAATPFPGIAALLPCVGAGLIIAAGKAGTSLIGETLSRRPLVFVGMISYSLYLWHWPLIIFQRGDGFLIKGGSVRLTQVAITCAAFVLATLSWRFVERPFREHPVKLSRAVIFRTASVAAAFFALVGAAIFATSGFSFRYPKDAVKVASFMEATATTDAHFRVGSCFLTSRDVYKDFDPSVCLREDPRKRNDLLLGDSHAAQLWYGLSSTLKDVNLMQATASGCKPTVKQSPNVDPKCARLMEYIFSGYLQNHHLDALIIAARWDDSDLGLLQETLHWSHDRGIPVILFGPIVQYDSALPRLLALSIKSNDPALPALHRIAYFERLDEDMSRLAQSEPTVRYVSYFQMLCHQSSCLEYANPGIPLQSDTGHLTTSGSLLVAVKVRDAGTFN
jgi:peptidoglycan/LPS O-acetylase OafA/YrhL